MSAKSINTSFYSCYSALSNGDENINSPFPLSNNYAKNNALIPSTLPSPQLPEDFVKSLQKRIKPMDRPQDASFWKKRKEKTNRPSLQIETINQILENKKVFVSSFLRESEVIIVDDDPFIRLVLSGLFQKACKEVRLYEKETGEESLEFLSNLMPLEESGRKIVFVMDNEMPGIGGIETIRSIRTKFPEYKNQISIIAHTSDGYENIRKMIELGANASLPKKSPATYNQFIDILYHLFALHSQ